MKQLRTVVIVALVAGLIWVFAEGQSLRRVTKTMEVTIRPDQAGRLIERVGAGLPARNGARGVSVSIEVTLEGPTSSLDRLDAARLAPVLVEPGSPGVPIAAGEHVVDLRELLRTANVWRDDAVSVVRTEPASLGIRVVELQSAEVPVAVVVPEGLRGRVTVRASREMATMRWHGEPPVMDPPWPEGDRVEARLSAEDLAGLSPGVPTTLAGVQLVPSAMARSLAADVGEVAIEPRLADVVVTLGGDAATVAVAAVPVYVRVAAVEQGLWEVRVPEDRVLSGVRLVGPASVLEPITSGEQVIFATVTLTLDDLRAGVREKAVELLDLPTGVRPEGSLPKVRLDIEPRREAGEG
ncbi:MAG: hypothetical protein AAF747_03625 [Planctomycetota bacterium]